MIVMLKNHFMVLSFYGTTHPSDLLCCNYYSDSYIGLQDYFRLKGCHCLKLIMPEEPN